MQFELDNYVFIPCLSWLCVFFVVFAFVWKDQPSTISGLLVGISKGDKIPFNHPTIG